MARRDDNGTEGNGRRFSRRTVGGAGVVVFLILLLIGYVVQWFGTASTVRDQLDKWRESRNDAGWAVSYGETGLHGFPFWVRLDVPDVSVAGPASANWRWETDSLMLEVSPLHPRDVKAHLTGRHRVRLANGASLTVDAGKALAEVSVATWGRIKGLKLAAEKLAVEGPWGPGSISVEKAHLSADRKGDGKRPEDGGGGALPPVSWTAELMADNVGFPPHHALPLGRRLKRLLLDVRARGPLKLTDSLRVNARRFNKADGRVEVREMSVDWPPLRVDAGGRLWLDDGRQPRARLTAQARGFFQALDTFAEAGLMPRDNVSVAKVVLGMLARPGEGPGEGPVLSLPVVVEDSTLFVGPAELARVPEIDWGGTRTGPVRPGVKVTPEGEVIQE